MLYASNTIIAYREKSTKNIMPSEQRYPSQRWPHNYTCRVTFTLKTLTQYTNGHRFQVVTNAMVVHGLALHSTDNILCLPEFLPEILTVGMVTRTVFPLPPGPKGYPLIGNFFDMPVHKPWVVYDEWRKTYGKPFTLKVWGTDEDKPHTEITDFGIIRQGDTYNLPGLKI